MIRKYLLTAALLTLAVPLYADDSTGVSENVTDQVPPPVTFADVADEGEPLQWDVPLQQPVKANLTDWQAEEGDAEAPPMPITEGLDPQIDGCGGCSQCYYPVDTCGCKIPYMDPWCYCETSCCTTDEWCSNPCECAPGDVRMGPDGCWVSNDMRCDVYGKPIHGVTDPLRFGWWAVSSRGSKVKTGEFQDLRSSPFFDLDTMYTNGNRTLDLSLTGMDNEANSARARFYSPNMKGNIRYDRYLRRLDHDPLAGFASTPPGIPANPGPADDVVVTDLNLGDDYAIRVNQLDAKFQGRLTDNVNWKLNVWGMRKFGERQQNAVAHCFNFNAPGAINANETVCHVVSQRQTIDWMTMEVTPGLEARYDNVSFEYTRTMRAFGQSDQLIDRNYTRFNFTGVNNTLGPDYYYGITPENYTQIDRLKMVTQLNDYNSLYANMYLGDTKNEFRGMHRQFGGWDVRLTNTANENLTTTVYTSNYEENNSYPMTYFNAPPYSPANGWDRAGAGTRHVLDYQRTRAGVNGRWVPLDSGRYENLAWVGGYEYYLLARDWATYDSARLGVFTQPDTETHQFELGPQMRWNAALTTYAKYKVRFVDEPLIGVRESNGKLNTNLPNQDHRVDFGGTWTPSENFNATAQFSIQNAWNYTQYASFSETSYPLNFTVWYAPTDRFSVTSGYAYFTNWIDQDIGQGFRTTVYEALPWSYSGQNHLVSLSGNYALTQSVQLVGGYEWNHGSNVFVVPASATGANWSQLGTYSDVVVETQRITGGVDWQAAANLDVYFRYNFFDYNDLGAAVDSGTAHMALAGFSLVR